MTGAWENVRLHHFNQECTLASAGLVVLFLYVYVLVHVHVHVRTCACTYMHEYTVHSSCGLNKAAHGGWLFCTLHLEIPW